MEDANWQHSHSHIHTLLQSLSTDPHCHCGVIQTNQETAPSRYDRWLKPRPNTEWQDFENQRFVDFHPYDDGFVDEEECEHIDESESNDIADEMPDREEESDVRIEDEAHTGRRLACSVSNRLEVANEVILGTDSQLISVRHQPVPEQEASNEAVGPLEQEDDVITQFLEVMEDQDLRRDSVARLKSFFKSATLECLDKCSMAWTRSRILLEDRNFSAKTFRPYSRSLTPKQLYDALRGQVGRPYYSGFFWTNICYRGIQKSSPQTLKVWRRVFGRSRKTVSWKGERCR